MTASSKKSEEQDQTNDPATNKIVSGTPLLVTSAPFNAKALRLPSAFEHNAGIRKVINDIPVRKPHSQE